jgi:CO/xanthine dehydrogenase FAD-binding subunit
VGHVAFAVFEPATLNEALGLLANEGDASAALAGGTDLLLRIRRGARKYRSIVNIKFVPGLTGLTWDAQRGLTMGALTTFRTIEAWRLEPRGVDDEPSRGLAVRTDRSRARAASSPLM